ncbi:MAG TPA: hypothetical protein VHE60_05255 [Pyrinomonadaceae bacterium]|nr:hypothetical protein [Pyrinomonadaceae bacterium]
MTSRTTTLAVNFRRTKCRRLLGYLLSLLIVYGATVEAAHSHGSVAPDRPGVAAISDAGGSPSSDKGNSHHRECSMCQFQQQLFGGLVHAPLFARTPLAEIAFVSTLTVFYPSTSTTPRSGRAPPLV